jgi:hypothetical protein
MTNIRKGREMSGKKANLQDWGFIAPERRTK